MTFNYEGMTSKDRIEGISWGQRAYATIVILGVIARVRAASLVLSSEGTRVSDLGRSIREPPVH